MKDLMSRQVFSLLLLFGMFPFDGFVVCLQIFHWSSGLCMSWLDVADQELSGTQLIIAKILVKIKRCVNRGWLFPFLGLLLSSFIILLCLPILIKLVMEAMNSAMTSTTVTKLLYKVYVTMRLSSIDKRPRI